MYITKIIIMLLGKKNYFLKNDKLKIRIKIII